MALDAVRSHIGVLVAASQSAAQRPQA